MMAFSMSVGDREMPFDRPKAFLVGPFHLSGAQRPQVEPLKDVDRGFKPINVVSLVQPLMGAFIQALYAEGTWATGEHPGKHVR